MSIWGPKQYTTTGDDPFTYRVKLYGQPVTTANKLSDQHVTFKYADLINRAIRAKEMDNDRDVTIRFAIYKITKDVYVGIDPAETDTYGTVAGVDSGSSTEKLLYSLIRAAIADVQIELLLQKDGAKDNDDDNISDITDYLNDDNNWGRHSVKKCNIELNHIQWGVCSDCQMHNKFMLVSHVEGDNNCYENCIYTTTANVDPWDGYIPRKEYYQTGVTIYNHPPLYQKYLGYFNLICENSSDQSAFSRHVLLAHNSGTLNYVEENDPYLSAYFYPISTSRYWDTEFNPIALMIDKLQNRTDMNRYIKGNMAFLRKDFTDGFIEALEPALRDNLNIKMKVHSDTASNNNVPQDFKDLCDYYDDKLDTHTKNWQFVVYEDDNITKSYYSITGSINAKENGYLKKSNNAIMLKDDSDDNWIYRAFKEMYEAV